MREVHGPGRSSNDNEKGAVSSYKLGVRPEALYIQANNGESHLPRLKRDNALFRKSRHFSLLRISHLVRGNGMELFDRVELSFNQELFPHPAISYLHGNLLELVLS